MSELEKVAALRGDDKKLFETMLYWDQKRAGRGEDELGLESTKNSQQYQHFKNKVQDVLGIDVDGYFEEEAEELV